MTKRRQSEFLIVFMPLVMVFFFSAAIGAAIPKTEIPDFVQKTEIRLNEDLLIRKVADGVFVITHSFPWAANSLLVEMENSDLLLIDTPYTPEATKDLLDWTAKTFGHGAMTVINTGFHYDNLGGNSVLKARGIPVYGSRMTAGLLAERGEKMRALTLEWLKAPGKKRYYEVHKKLLYTPPTNFFDIDNGLKLEFGSESVEVYYPGPSHSPDNVVVYLPERRVLFGGCMVIGWKRVGNTADADLKAWPESVKKLKRFDADIIVPGHGARLDPDLLNHTISLLEQYPGVIFDHPPAFRDSIAPEYPVIALRAQIEGTVVIKATIDSSGGFVDAEIVDGVNPLLNRAAVDAMQGSSFVPATLGGKSVAGPFLVSYPFNLDCWYRDNLRQERPAINWAPPLISEVGELVKEAGSSGSMYGVYRFENIRFYGDLSVKTYRSVMDQVSQHLENGEKVLSINHYLAYREFGQMTFDGINDLVITTCTDTTGPENCGSGNIYKFTNMEGDYTLVLNKGNHTRWVH